ncbi:MAG: hypothetical protein QNI99_09545 [Woeseiaceae bacterium]|nr:hypothetical protein [Woeseiaceae bacterium]
MQFLDHEDVIVLRQLKERSEIQLVQRLDELFTKSQLGIVAQNQVRLLVGKMLSEWRETGQRYLRHAANTAMADEGSLRLWDRVGNRNSVVGLTEIYRCLGRYGCDLHDCADILRLFGAYAENAAEAAEAAEIHTEHKGVSAMREPKDDDHPLSGAFRKQQSIDPRKLPPDKLKAGQDPRQREAKSKAGAFRARGEGGAVTAEDVAAAREVKKLGLAPASLVPWYLEDLFESQPSPTVMSGCNRWALRMQSKSCQIDKAFGLPFGGDISGTTSDSMYGLDVARKLAIQSDTTDVRKLDFLVLMPLISLVGLYNHTILECALALMYCDVIDDYRIGYYSTLFPRKCGQDRYADIYAALLQAEQTSPKLIVYSRQDLLLRGSTKILRGFLMTTEAEVNRFSPLASVNDFYRNALRYPGNSARAVIQLMDRDPALSHAMAQAVTAYDARYHHQTGSVPPPSWATSESDYLRYAYLHDDTWDARKFVERVERARRA